jgi:hypothetical protein
MHDDESVVDILSARWCGVRGRTYDVLDVLDEPALGLRLPFPESLTLGSQFRCMLGAQESYTRAIAHGGWQGFSCSLDDLAAVTPAIIAAHMRRADEALAAAVQAAPPAPTAGGGRRVDQTVQRLIEHETLHHGQLINFLFCHHLPIPRSWRDEWALMDED